MIDTQNLDTARKMFAMAQEKRNVAQQLHDNGNYNDAISRAYYAVFHLVSMVMFLHGKTYSSHSQLIGAFNKELIATEALPKAVGKAVRLLFDLRQGADYDFYQRIDPQESYQALEDTAQIFTSIQIYIANQFSVDLL